MDLIERLRRIGLFADLLEEDLWLVAETCEELDIASNTQLSRQAERGATFFIVESGQAIIHHVNEQGVRRPVGMLKAGDSFGLTSLFLGEPRDVTVTAQTDMHIWRIRRAAFQDLIAEYPRLKRRLQIPDAIREKLRAPRYDWLMPGELVVYHSRRHWVVFAKPIAVTTIVIFVGLLLFIWASVKWPMPSLSLAFMAVVLGIYALYILWHLFDWRNDYFVVSTSRIVYREKVAFLFESFNEVPLDRVQAINVVHTWLGKLFKYGNLNIDTAADIGNMYFTYIPVPERMRSAIWDQIARAQAIRQAMQRDEIRKVLAKHLALEPAESSSEVEPGAEMPIEEIETPQRPEVHPGKLARALIFLGERDFFPRTHIETAERTTWRKHWLFLISSLELPVFVTLCCGVLLVAGFQGWPSVVSAFFPQYSLVLLAIAIVSAGWFAWEYTDWGNDLYIVTSEQIIDIEKRPLFSREARREASLGMIQNVRYEKPNFRASLFNYGNVIVQTAGTGEFTFDGVGDPHGVQNKIFQRMAAFREAQRERESARRQTEMADWFSVYKEIDTGSGPKVEGLPDQLYATSEMHRLFDILFVAVSAAICGADTWAEVERFGYAKLNWLRTRLELPNGIPDSNMFWQVFARLKPDRFQDYFLSTVRTMAPVGSSVSERVAGQSRARMFGQADVGTLSVWTTADRLVLGQIRDDEASNEALALPGLLEVLDLSDCIVTVDVGDLWQAVADGSRSQRGNYLLTLEEEHGRIYEDVRRLFQHCQRSGYDDVAHDYHKTVDEHRGRIEIRQSWVIGEPEYLRYLAESVERHDLRSVAMVMAERYTGDVRSTETRWYVSSLPCDAKQLLYSLRGSWEVAKSFHWLLDVVVRGAQGRMPSGSSSPDFDVLRETALALLKQERVVGGDIESKRLKAMSSGDYLLRILTASDDNPLMGL